VVWRKPVTVLVPVAAHKLEMLARLDCDMLHNENIRNHQLRRRRVRSTATALRGRGAGSVGREGPAANLADPAVTKATKR
jgi:hypothetical protein